MAKPVSGHGLAPNSLAVTDLISGDTRGVRLAGCLGPSAQLARAAASTFSTMGNLPLCLRSKDKTLRGDPMGLE
eukprot:9481214-Pyramimonas_sp.AAC.1